MSFDALAWAAKQRTGSSGTKLVLMGLAECAGRKDALAFPCIAELIEFSALNRKSVIANLDALEHGGFITDSGERVGRTKQVKVYRLNLETVPKAEPSQKRNSSVISVKSPKNGTRNKSEPVISSEAKASSLWHALPANWVPTRSLSPNTKTMAENWPPGALLAELESFRAWAANAKPEKGKGLKKDWDDAFGNWIRSAHRDRYSRIASIQRSRTNPLTDLYRAAMQPENPQDGDGAWVSLPPAQHG